jgi:hypothetical protein
MVFSLPDFLIIPLEQLGCWARNADGTYNILSQNSASMSLMEY